MSGSGYEWIGLEVGYGPDCSLCRRQYSVVTNSAILHLSICLSLTVLAWEGTLLLRSTLSASVLMMPGDLSLSSRSSAQMLTLTTTDLCSR